jgi:hypothetical protein
MNAELFDSSTMEGKFRFQILRKDRIKGIWLRFLYWWVEQLLDSIGRGRVSWNELNDIKQVGTFVSKSWIRHAINTSATWKPVPFPVNNLLPDVNDVLYILWKVFQQNRNSPQKATVKRFPFISISRTLNFILNTYQSKTVGAWQT